MASFLTHHLLSIAMVMLSLGLTSALLDQRRPTGSTLAWILVILLMPYVGIPMYLVLGGRKFRRRAASKAQLKLAAHAGADGSSTGLCPPDGAPSSCAVEWLMDGVLAYRALVREIDGATKSIRIATFVLGDDETGRVVVDALTRRATEGLEVCLLVDDLLFYRAPRTNLARLRAAGGKVARFMPLLHLPFRGRSNLRNHRKMALFDGARGLLGGMNVAEEYMGALPDPARWCDFCALVSGPAAATLDAVFRADWLFAAGQDLPSLAVPSPVTEGVALRIVPSGPDRASDTLYDSLVQALFGAVERIWISTPYFVPDEVLMKALELASRRGVDVRIVVPLRSNHRLADSVAAPYLRELSTAGATVYRFTPTMLHAKAVIIDETLVSLGSANFDMRSFFLDYEIAALLGGALPAAHLAAWFQTLFVRSELGPPRAGRLARKLQSVIRLIAPLA